MTRRRNGSSALATLRRDDFGRFAITGLAAATGAVVGIIASKRIGKSTTASGLVGAGLGIASYLAVDLIDRHM